MTNNNITKANMVVYEYDSLFSAHFGLDSIRDKMSNRAMSLNVLAFNYIGTNDSLLTKVFKIDSSEEVIGEAMSSLMRSIDVANTIVAIPEFLQLVRYTELAIPFVKRLMKCGVRVIVGVDDLELYDTIAIKFNSFKVEELYITRIVKKTDVYCRVQYSDGLVEEVRRKSAWLEYDIRSNDLVMYTDNEVSNTYAILNCISKIKEMAGHVSIKAVNKGLLDDKELSELLSDMIRLGVDEEDLETITNILEKVLVLSDKLSNVDNNTKSNFINALGLNTTYRALIRMTEVILGNYLGNVVTSLSKDVKRNRILKIALKGRNSLNNVVREYIMEETKEA